VVRRLVGEGSLAPTNGIEKSEVGSRPASAYSPTTLCLASGQAFDPTP
jgi:hypothetical protein